MAVARKKKPAYISQVLHTERSASQNVTQAQGGGEDGTPTNAMDVDQSARRAPKP